MVPSPVVFSLGGRMLPDKEAIVSSAARSWYSLVSAGMTTQRDPAFAAAAQ